MFSFKFCSKFKVYTNLCKHSSVTRQYSVNKLSRQQPNLEKLSKSRDWRKAVNIINDKRILCTKSSINIFNNITEKAFSEADHSLGWEILHKIAEKNFQPNCETFFTYWNYCALHPESFVMNVEKMFEFMHKNDVIVSKNVIESLSNKIQHFGGVCSPAIMHDIGLCSSCQYQMPLLQQSQLEFHTLKREFEKVLLKPKISSTELGFFRQIVNRNKTFDYVVDSLNVTRIFPESKGELLKQGEILAKIVKRLRFNNKKILVIGKTHVQETFPEQSINFIRKNATVFLTKNKEAVDDIFLMYAAFVSGSKSHIVTNDLLEDYLTEFSEHGKVLFRNWQKQHQHFVTYDVNKDKIHINQPNMFARSVNKSTENGQWHIPFTERPLLFSLRGLIPVPVEWACINFKL